MNIPRNEAGSGIIKLLIVLLILIPVIHAGYKLIPMYMGFERMKDEMTVKASMATVLRDEDIRSDLVKKAMELDLPLREENFIMRRDPEQHIMAISAAWDVEVHFLFNIYVRTFHFELNVVQDYLKGPKL